MSEDLLREFLQTHELPEGLREPLQELLESYGAPGPGHAQTLDADLVQLLSQRRPWQPVSLQETPQTPPKVEAEEDDPLIYATADLPEDILDGDEADDGGEARPTIEHKGEPAPEPWPPPQATAPAPRPTVKNKRFHSSKAIQYDVESLLAEGGMSEIWRVHDRDLNRSMVMKLMKPGLEKDPVLLSRFIEEAQVTAQLEHPGIVPVHEFGKLDNGRFYFTMKEIKGQTFKEVIQGFHDASQDSWGTSAEGWSLWRLLDAFKRICEAIGYAHNHGVLHRDLKPSNIVVGEHGEVLVVDWGLVKLLQPEVPLVAGPAGRNPSPRTMVGELIGTPAYMAPEQVRDPSSVDARSDVYSLGAILYQLLSGQPPFVGYNEQVILFQMLSGPPYPPGRSEATQMPDPAETFRESSPSPWRSLDEEAPSRLRDKPPLPGGLIEICAKAMHREVQERYANGEELAQEIGTWLDGSRKRIRALEIVQQAEDRFPETWLLQTRAQALREEAAQKSQALEPWDPEELKHPVWDLEQQAQELEQQARLLELETEQLLKGALTHVPDLEEAHEALAMRYQKAHMEAEQKKQVVEAMRAELQMREHLSALPRQHPRRLELIEYLHGNGALTLHTDPPGAQVRLYRFEEERRRMQPQFVRDLGPTPIEALPLPMGSYLLELQAEGCQSVLYPMELHRRGHWYDGHPETGHIHPLRLPPAGSIPEGEALIPAGFFWTGDDAQQSDALPYQRVWVESFVIQRNPVTVQEYNAFLRDLRMRGEERLAEKYTPGHLGNASVWAADWPIIEVSWFAAYAYAQWWSRQTNLPWRLPFELEWEKAARGVDGRLYPWGDKYDPSWCHARDSKHQVKSPTSVHQYPVDTSVYGIRHMAGNTMDWCLDTHTREGPPIANGLFLAGVAWERSLPHVEELTPDDLYKLHRGGAWSYDRYALRTSHRRWTHPRRGHPRIGLRLVRPY